VAIFTALLPHKAQTAVLNKQILIGEVWIGNSTCWLCIEKDTAFEVAESALNLGQGMY
jgi:hypothetical protein